MASAAARTANSVSRSWSCAVARISRSAGGSSSSSVAQFRSYSGEGLQDPVPASPDASAAAPADSPADSPTSGEVPPAIPKPVKDTSGAPKTDYGKNWYPPRHFRTPRGVYKAIVLGEVGQLPIQKILKSGKTVTIFSVGTGGMYNNRRPFEGESPEEFAERSYTQWHRVSVYQDRVSSMVMQHVKVGSQVYLEGNIESRVYNDPNSGLVKRIQEIAIRANGRLMFMEASGVPKSVAQRPAEAVPISAPPTDPQSGPEESVQSLP